MNLKTGSIVGAELSLFLRRNISSLTRSRAILTFVIIIEGLSSEGLLFLNNRSINLPCDVTVYSCGDKRGIKTLVQQRKKKKRWYFMQIGYKNNGKITGYGLNASSSHKLFPPPPPPPPHTKSLLLLAYSPSSSSSSHQVPPPLPPHINSLLLT